MMKKFLSSIMICVMSITSTGAISCFAAENPPESATICTAQDNINSEKEMKDLVAESVTKPEDTTNKNKVVKSKSSKLLSFVILSGKIISKVYSLCKFASFFYKTGNKSGYDKGNKDGFNTGYDKGYDEGKKLSFDQGRVDGYKDGYDRGKAQGYANAINKGYGDKYYDGLLVGMMGCVDSTVTKEDFETIFKKVFKHYKK